MAHQRLARAVLGDEGGQMVFDLLVPGGGCMMVTRPVSLAKRCNPRFHRLPRAPLFPPRSALMVSAVAFG